MQPPGRRIERAAGPCRRHRSSSRRPCSPHVHQGGVGSLLERPGRERKVRPELLVRAAVLVAQRARHLREFGQVARLEERVAGVGGEAAEQVRAQHRGDHGPVAAAALAGDRPVGGLGQRPVALRPRTARPRRTGRCGSGPCPASRGTAPALGSSTRRRRRRSPAQHPPVANQASIGSGTCRALKALRLRHMSTWPVMPWMR